MNWKPLTLVVVLMGLISFFFQGEDFDKYLKKMYKDFDVPQTNTLDFDQFVLIDTRSVNEFNASHIKNSIHINYDMFSGDELKRFNKTDTIVLYCSVGYRSCKAAEVLIKNGFTSVYNLYGGIFKWANDSNKIFSNGKETNRLHTYSKKWGRYVTNPKILKVND